MWRFTVMHRQTDPNRRPIVALAAFAGCLALSAATCAQPAAPPSASPAQRLAAVDTASLVAEARLKVAARKIGSLDVEGNVSTFGWASENLEMIRSPAGAVWIRIVEDHLSADEQAILLEYLKFFEPSEEP